MHKEDVAPALGMITSGLYIATSIHGGDPVGMLCSFVEQASFDPPMFTLAVSPGRLLDEALAAGSPLGLNIIGEGEGALMKPFAQPGNENPFAGLEVSDHRGVMRLQAALAFLYAEPRGSMEAGDHRIYLCEVLDGALQHQGGTPMVRVRKNGFNY